MEVPYKTLFVFSQSGQTTLMAAMNSDAFEFLPKVKSLVVSLNHEQKRAILSATHSIGEFVTTKTSVRRPKTDREKKTATYFATNKPYSVVKHWRRIIGTKLLFADITLVARLSSLAVHNFNRAMMLGKPKAAREHIAILEMLRDTTSVALQKLNETETDQS